MKEIGGYIEVEYYKGKMLYDDGVKINCGRNALEYIILAKKIKRILMPRFMCDSCNGVLARNNVSVRYYSIGYDFKPQLKNVYDDEYIYIVNYYGQLTNEYIASIGYKNIIVDNSQAYFQKPISGVDTIYTCRKFFGVSDGAIVYTSNTIDITLQDESFERMRFLMGRFERSASEFYDEYVNNNHLFKNEPIKRMSKLTENLLHSFDYDMIKNKRTENFRYLHEHLSCINKLTLDLVEGGYMYPLMIENAEKVRKQLQKKKIYIPILWPSVFSMCKKEEKEYYMADNILPLPLDQRYDINDMQYIIEEILNEI